MSLEDTEINAFVRKALCRHLVNLSDVKYRTVNKRVRIYGWLERLPLAGKTMDSETVDAMFREIERIPGVVQVLAEFENWDRAGKGWSLSAKGRDALIHGRPKDHITGAASSTWRLAQPTSQKAGAGPAADAKPKLRPKAS